MKNYADWILEVEKCFDRAGEDLVIHSYMFDKLLAILKGLYHEGYNEYSAMLECWERM